MKKNITVLCDFDNFSSKDFRFIQEASCLGELYMLLYSDQTIQSITGKAPKYPVEERLYAANSLRWVKSALPAGANPQQSILKLKPDIYVSPEEDSKLKAFCENNSIRFQVIDKEKLRGFPLGQNRDTAPGKKKVLVTGCFDWFHTGHIRFFEEASEYGELYVVVGTDKNLRLLKGEGHPMFPQEERRYMVNAIKHVHAAMISTGEGWLDAEPEIRKIKPDIYLINSDSGGQEEKQKFCDELGIELVILKREPAQGLPKRSSTDLRGF